MPITILIITTIKIYKVRKDVGLIILRSAQILKNIRLPFPDLRFIEGQTNCLKNVLKHFFHFPQHLKIFYKLFFQASQAAIIPGPRYDIPSQEISFPGGYQRVLDGDMGDVLSIHGLRFSRQMIWYHHF